MPRTQEGASPQSRGKPSPDPTADGGGDPVVLVAALLVDSGDADRAGWRPPERRSDHPLFRCTI